MNNKYRINFSEGVGPDRIGDLLLDAITVTEAILGKEALRREAFFNMDEETPRLDVSVKGPAGEAFLRCLRAILERDFDSSEYAVRRAGEGGEDETETVLVVVAIAII